jgi:GntR family transcriptional regulator
MLVHVTGGALALVSGYAALFARKGGRVHRRVGMRFVLAMLAMGAGALGVGLARGTARWPGGLLVVYLVNTAATTVRRADRPSPWLDRTRAGTALVLLFLVMGVPAVRMCFAMFMATDSFFFGLTLVAPAIAAQGAAPVDAGSSCSSERLRLLEGDHDAAIRNLERAIALDGTRAEYRYWLGRARYEASPYASKLRVPGMARRVRIARRDRQTRSPDAIARRDRQTRSPDAIARRDRQTRARLGYRGGGVSGSHHACGAVPSTLLVGKDRRTPRRSRVRSAAVRAGVARISHESACQAGAEGAEMSTKWTDDAPLYRQLRDRAVAMILDQALKEGDALPSARTVAATDRVNPLTVLKAYQQLADEELVENRPGLGLFVRPGARERLLVSERRRFVQEQWPRIRATMQRLGLDPEELLWRSTPARPKARSR